MQKIVSASSRDLPSLAKCLRRAEIPYQSPLLSEDELSQSIEEGRTLVFKDGAKVFAFSSIYDFPLEILFPNSPKDQNDFLENIRYRGEPLLLLEGIYADPMYQRKGYASLLFSSLCAKKKEATFLARLPIERAELLPFFKKVLFAPYGFLPSGDLLIIRKKKKEGLCSDPSF